MSGTFPVSPGARDTELTSIQPELTDISQSGKRQSSIIAGHLWEVTCNYPPMLRDEFAPLFAFSISQRGDDFQITLPNFNVPRGVATGTPLVDGIHAAADSAIAIDGWTASITGILKAGSLIKFASHSKVYMTTADVDSGASPGLSSVPIIPPLIEALADNEAVTINNVPITMAFKNGGVQEFKTKIPGVSSFAIDLVESI